MKYSIRIEKSSSSRLSQIDFSNIPFGRNFSDHMFVADYKNGEWTDLRVVPFEPFLIHPGSMVLHYGQSIFEGMKASKNNAGQAMLLRPEMHAQRFNRSAARMSMPDVPEDLFLQALHAIVHIDSAWIPPQEGSALYLRPLMFANDEFIGVHSSENYRFIIMTGPVGPYYPKPIRLWAERVYVRAVKGGTGEAKAAGNYAGSLLPAKLAAQRGFDQIMWMDAHEFKYIQEAGTMNIFFVIGDTVITPAADGAILKGITRDSILHILKDKGIPVEERPIAIDEVIAAYHAGTLREAFGAGTAAVVSHVIEIGTEDLLLQLPPVDQRPIGELIKSEINGLRSGRIPDTRGWLVPVVG
ncbi:MAG: branched-chain amino acid aminotransferase [Saprospiraceae bacterium]|nr:branched-chain amino acid aminotransferase [Saprospiraceae bacterium]